MEAGPAIGGQPGRHNLPASLTSFLGRRGELRDLATWLGGHRLVTVTGAGGSGKTRLAVELARSLVTRFEMGAWLVELGQLEDAALVPSAAAGVLGVRQQPGLSMADSVALALAGRHILLVLDNCEQVIDAAAELCERLLPASEDLRILVTSREPLGVRGEARFACPPLPIPPAGGPARSGDENAVSLFAERARQIDVGFELTTQTGPMVARLVRLLDGMPLAIELAAAQLDVLTLGQLLGDLDGSLRVLINPVRGVAARQASLEASIGWSYRLLDRAEQAAFRRLSVFPAPFTQTAAAAAVGPGVPGLPDLLARLVRRSMVLPPRSGTDGQPRYAMLGTLRTYGRARLGEAGETQGVRAAVTDWAMTEAERAAGGFDREPTELAAARWFDSEHDNLREILDWTRTADPDRGLRLACTTIPWWNLRGRYEEGRRLLEAAISACEAPPAPLLTTAEVWTGRFGVYTGDYDRALSWLDRAAGRAEEHRLDQDLAASLNTQAEIFINTGRLDQACTAARRALGIAQSAGYASGEAWAAGMLSIADQVRGNWAGSLAWARRSAAIPAGRLTGDTSRKRATQLAEALEHCGDVDSAEAIHLDELERCRAAGARDDLAHHLLALARIQIRQSRPGPAAGYLAEAMVLYSAIGFRGALIDCFTIVAAWAASRAPEAALTLCGAAAALARDTGVSLEGDESIAQFLAAPLAAARRQAGEVRSRQAEARGASLPLAAALDFARDLLDESTWATGSAPAMRLTVRERELLGLVAEGLTDREIAAKLFISVRTVRSHLDRIRNKTGARRRAELTMLAVRSEVSETS